MNVLYLVQSELSEPNYKANQLGRIKLPTSINRCFLVHRRDNVSIQKHSSARSTHYSASPALHSQSFKIQPTTFSSTLVRRLRNSLIGLQSRQASEAIAIYVTPQPHLFLIRSSAWT